MLLAVGVLHSEEGITECNRRLALLSVVVECRNRSRHVKRATALHAPNGNA
jgi:hypothetical protein